MRVKATNYEVLGVARHSETEEEYVVYRALYGDRRLWIRPMAMFLETVIVGLVYLVGLVGLGQRVGLVQPNKQDKPNKPINRDKPDRPDRPNEQDRLADFFSIQLAG